MTATIPRRAAPHRQRWAVNQVAERLFQTGAGNRQSASTWADQPKSVKAFYRRMAREAIEAVTAVLVLGGALK